MAYGQNITVPNFSNAVGQTPAERWRFSTLNDMMLSIGLAGIDYYDSTTDTMEGQHALRILTDVIYGVESEGWEYNTLKNLKIRLDERGGYKFGVTEPMPLGCLAVFSIVGQNDDMFITQDGVIKTRNLENSADGTFLGKPFTEITLDSVIIELWQSMHFALTQYVSALAIMRYEKMMVGSLTATQATQQDLQKKYVDARRDEIRSGKYNILNSSFGQEVNR